MAISGAKYIGVQEKVSGTIVNIYQLIPDGCKFTPEPKTVTEVNGCPVYNGVKYSLEVTSADLSKFSQMETWMKSKASIRVIVFGLNENLYWYEYTTFLVKRDYKTKTGQRNTFTLKMQFIGETTNIYNIKA